MILSRVAIVLACIIQHTFTNARELIQGEEGEKIEGYRRNEQDSSDSMATVTSYLRGDSSNIRSEVSNRNLGVVEKCNIEPGKYFIQSVQYGTVFNIANSGVHLSAGNSWMTNNYIRSLGNNEYAIKRGLGEYYVKVPKSGNYHWAKTQTYVGDNERFYIHCYDNGEVAFQSKRFGNYLYPETGTPVYVRTWVWENPSLVPQNARFRLITEGLPEPFPEPEKTYYIKSHHGTYIRMWNKNKVDLAPHKKSHEKITLRPICDLKDCDRYAIQSATHGERYLRVPGKGSGRTINTQTYVDDNEEFEIIRDPSDPMKVSFKSVRFGNFLRANKGKNAELDTATHMRSHEIFTLIPV